MNKNEKSLSLKIPDKANIIMNFHKKDQKENDGYVFPFLKDVNNKNAEDIFVKTRTATKLFIMYLKRIARHSFGNIAGEKIHPLMLQKLYRHSDLKTTLNYQTNFIYKGADDARESVIYF